MNEPLKVVESLPVSTAIIDPSGTIVGVNEAWKAFGRRNGLNLPNHGVGSSYLAHCGSEESATGIARDLRELLAGQRNLVVHVYPCDSPEENRSFILLAFPMALSGTGGIAILHADISNLLPLPVIEGLLRRQRAELERYPQHTALAAISAIVEASASNALSSQLQTMLSLPPRHSDEAEALSTVSDEALLRARLSKRQMEVLRLLGEGKSNREIAELLYRSPHTVKLHVSAILRQLDVKSRTQAALLASQLSKQR